MKKKELVQIIQEEIANILREQEIAGGEGVGLDDSQFRNAPMINKAGQTGKQFGLMLAGLLRQGKITKQQDEDISATYMSMLRTAKQVALDNGSSEKEAYAIAKKSAHDSAITAIKGALAATNKTKASASPTANLRRQKNIAAKKAAQVGPEGEETISTMSPPE